MPGLAWGTGDTRSEPSQSISSSRFSHGQLVVNVSSAQKCTSKCGCVGPGWVINPWSEPESPLIQLVKGGVKDGDSHVSGPCNDRSLGFSSCFYGVRFQSAFLRDGAVEILSSPPCDYHHPKETNTYTIESTVSNIYPLLPKNGHFSWLLTVFLKKPLVSASILF